MLRLSLLEHISFVAILMFVSRFMKFAIRIWRDGSDWGVGSESRQISLKCTKQQEFEITLRATIQVINIAAKYLIAYGNFARIIQPNVGTKFLHCQSGSFVSDT